MKQQDKRKCRVNKTGKKICVVNVAHGTYKDVKTGEMYMFDEIEFAKPRRRLMRFGFHIWRFGMFFFAREFANLNSWYVVPGVSVDFVNGYDCYVDVEAKILCFGIGVRFIWIKQKPTK